MKRNAFSVCEQPVHMTGVQKEDSVRDYEDGMEVDTYTRSCGRFEDVNVVN